MSSPIASWVPCDKDGAGAQREDIYYGVPLESAPVEGRGGSRIGQREALSCDAVPA